MTTKQIINLGTTMGLNFDASSNFADSMKKGIVVFDGCNGQRFLIDANWKEKKVKETIGESLITYGKRLKCLELNRVLSINSDYNE